LPSPRVWLQLSSRSLAARILKSRCRRSLLFSDNELCVRDCSPSFHTVSEHSEDRRGYHLLTFRRTTHLTPQNASAAFAQPILYSCAGSWPRTARRRALIDSRPAECREPMPLMLVVGRRFIVRSRPPTSMPISAMLSSSARSSPDSRASSSTSHARPQSRPGSGFSELPQANSVHTLCV
jgi:hypothetical protein